MPDPKDKKLATEASKGNIEAFEELVDIYYKGIVGICYSVLGNNEDALDCTQETFVKAYKNIHKYDSRSSFFTWVYRIAINTSYDFVRKKKRQREVFSDNVIDTGKDYVRMQLKDEKDGPHEKLIKKISDVKVRSIICSLPEKYSRIIFMKDIEGLSYKEISEIEGINEGTVKSRLFRAREKFADLAKKEDLYE